LAHRPPARQPRAHSAIVGGIQTSIERVPWQVALLGEIPVEIEGEKGILEELCGGAILGETRVLTAAHCMFNPQTGEQAPAEDFVVVAGSSDLDERESTEQDVAVAGIHVHPYFNYDAGPGTPDDVAILKLNRSLNLSGAAARAISVASAGSIPSRGSPVELSGFGQQSIGSEPSGKLYSLNMSLGTSEACGGEADAVFLCASAPAGSACGGDGGGGLTSSGATPVLLGVLSTIEVISGENCHEGADSGFTNLAAPEVSDFIEDEATLPPKAPRGGAGVELIFSSSDGHPLVGESLTCSPGRWSGSPTFTYNFIRADGQVLQSGSSPTYQVTMADVGDAILCELEAANAGGTAIERTIALPAVEDVPRLPGENTPLPPAENTPTPFKPEPPASIEGDVARSSAEGVARAEAERKAREAANKPWMAPPPPNEGPCGAEGVLCGGEIVLASASIMVRSDGMALVKLACKGNEECSGKLVFSAETTSRAKSAKKRSRTVTLGTARFSIAAGKTITVKIGLDAVGRALLGTDHGRVNANLAVLEFAPSPSLTHTESVQLVRQKVARGRKR
jgi:hypothetical protein